MNFTCPRGHKVSAPVTLLICPLSSCQEQLRPAGPNWGPLKSKKGTAEHYGSEAKKADA